MHPTTLDGFLDEMMKIAFGPKQADKVLSLAKKIQLPKASRRVMPGLSGGPDAKKFMKGVDRSTRPYGEIAGRVAEEAKKHYKDSPSLALTTKGKKIFPGNTGHLGKALEESGIGQALKRVSGPAPRVPASQQKMFHAVLKGHELDEATVPSRLGAAHFGHRSPDVIFREHNRVATLPKGNEAAVSAMKHYRGKMEGSQLFPKGIEYGSGQRLSRHARKRLTALAEQKVVAQTKPAFKQMLETA